MYFQTGVLTRMFRVASGIKSTRKVFCQATELLVLIDHEFAGNSTSPLFAFLLCPFHMGISLPLGNQLVGGFWDKHGCEKPKSKSCANAKSVYL